jgi:hypothetical protein
VQTLRWFGVPVSARKTGTLILRAEMLDWIIAIGDRIRTSWRGLCELLSAGSNHSGANAGSNNDAIAWLQARLHRLRSTRRTSPGRDPSRRPGRRRPGRRDRVATGAPRPSRAKLGSAAGSDRAAEALTTTMSNGHSLQRHNELDALNVPTP